MAEIGYIQVTRTCNQNCLFCSNPPFEKETTLKSIQVILEDYKKKGYSSVIFSGGEPTLYKDLDKAIAMAKSMGFDPRVITNGQKTWDYEYFKHLVDAGLMYINFSVHSHREDLQNFLTCNEHSHERLVLSMKHSAQFPLTVNITTVINRYNQEELHLIMEWLVENFPHIPHFVINNMDPYMNRAAENPEVIPDLVLTELSLFKAMNYLESQGRSFRVERVPLCYMADFAHCSTETRKIVKQEERATHFLDNKGYVLQNTWDYPKSTDCQHCYLNSLCAGLYSGGDFYNTNSLYPVFLSKEAIINKID